MVKNNLLNILPGLTVSIGVASASILLAKFIPSLGAATISIALGMVLGNTFLNKKSLAPGYKFAESSLLSYSIVLLGATLSIPAILNLGFSGISFIIIQMAVTIAAALYIGKRLNFSQDFRYLMASGNAVCGSSAIMATSSSIDASEEDRGMSIAIVNFTGVILMVLLPVISGAIYGHESLKTSAMIGGTLQSIGQVVASGAMVSERVKDLSTIFKILRVILLFAVVILFQRAKGRSSDERGIESADLKVAQKKKGIMPWYVTGFFILCMLSTFGIIPEDFSEIAKASSSKLEITALAAIGLKINFKELIAHGKSVSIYGLSIGAVQVVSSIVLIALFL